MDSKIKETEELYKKACQLFNNKNYKEAKKNYELVSKNCTELEKSNINLINYGFDKSFCLAQIARCYLMEKDIGNAIAYFQKSIDLCPMADTISDLVDIYLRLKDFNNVFKYSKIYGNPTYTNKG